MSLWSENMYYVLMRARGFHIEFFCCLYITFSLFFESKKVRDSKLCAACSEFSRQPLHAAPAAVT